MELEVTSGIDASMVIKLTLDAFTAEKLLVKKPRSLPTATFCALLIEQALDTPGMLAERAEASVASTLLSSSSLKDKSNKNICKDLSSRKSRKRPDYTDEFLAFWNEYQKAPTKAIGQSKYKAFDQWRAAVKREAPEKLVEAARRAVELVTQAKLRDEWCAPLPDAFRWLRDEHYAVHLEDHVPAGPRMINGYMVYD